MCAVLRRAVESERRDAGRGSAASAACTPLCAACTALLRPPPPCPSRLRFAALFCSPQSSPHRASAAAAALCKRRATCRHSEEAQHSGVSRLQRRAMGGALGRQRGSRSRVQTHLRPATTRQGNRQTKRALCGELPRASCLPSHRAHRGRNSAPALGALCGDAAGVAMRSSTHFWLSCARTEHRAQ